METQINFILWALTAGFGITFGILLVLWNNLNQRFDKVEIRFDKLDEKVTDVDRRLCRLEGAFSSKDCCMIKDDRQIKKAE